MAESRLHPRLLRAGSAQQLPVSDDQEFARLAERTHPSPKRGIMKLWTFVLLTFLALVLCHSQALAQEEEPWLTRNAPEDGLWELGFYWGGFLPDSNLELYDANPDTPGGPVDFDSPTLEVGVRAAYFPLAAVGLELEAAAADMQTTAGGGGSFQMGRAHLVAQMTPWSLVPFAMVGLGALSVKSDPDVAGNDTDFSYYVGLGTKFELARWFQLRADARSLFSPDKDGGFPAASLQFQMGLAFVLGRSAEHTPVTDYDLDGFVGPEDRCAHEAETINDFQDDDGCPDDPNDRDGDKLNNDVDSCPDQAEDFDEVEDTDGCPDVEEAPKDVEVPIEEPKL